MKFGSCGKVGRAVVGVSSSASRRNRRRRLFGSFQLSVVRTRKGERTDGLKMRRCVGTGENNIIIDRTLKRSSRVGSVSNSSFGCEFVKITKTAAGCVKAKQSVIFDTGTIEAI